MISEPSSHPGVLGRQPKPPGKREPQLGSTRPFISSFPIPRCWDEGGGFTWERRGPWNINQPRTWNRGGRTQTDQRVHLWGHHPRAHPAHDRPAAQLPSAQDTGTLNSLNTRAGGSVHLGANRSMRLQWGRRVSQQQLSPTQGIRRWKAAQGRAGLAIL